MTDGQSGETLPGVNILVKGTSTGTSTNAEGKYELTVESLQDTLVVSFVGYQTKEVPIEERTEIDIVLQSQAITGEEMVVVGYGTQEKENLTGSIGVVSSDEIENRTFASTSNTLQGVSPGLTIIDRGGAPGNENTEINIRGVGTLGNSEPLILVDNVPVESMDAVRPSNIDNISILKDAASAAIYGSRAANGVVLISTKRGQAGDITVNYNGRTTTQRTTRLPESVGIENYLRIINEGYRNRNLNVPYSDEYIRNSINGNNPYQYPDTDWLDTIFEPGFSMEHSIGISGGSENSVFRLSMDYLDTKGIIENTESQNYNIRLNNDFYIGEKLNITTNVSFNRENNEEPNRINEIYWNLYSDLPRPTVAQYPDGSYGLSRDGSNPLAVINESGTNNVSTNNYLLDIKGSYNLLKNFSVDGRYSFRQTNIDQNNHAMQYTFTDYETGDQINSWPRSLSD